MSSDKPVGADGGTVATDTDAGTGATDTDGVDTAAGRCTGRFRGRVEAVAGGLFGLLTAVMVLFLLAEWLRGSIGGMSILYDQYLIVGQWLDFWFGTIVFSFGSTWRALAAGLLIGFVAPILGTFLIHQQMALIGETLAHTAFAGVAAGVVVVAFTGWAGSLVFVDLGSQGGLLFVALVVSALGALGLQWLSQHSDSYGDVPIAIVLSGSFAMGTLLISWSRDFAPISIDIEGFLFGSLAIVTTQGARLIALISVLVAVIVVVHFKQFVFITFDEEAARVAGLPVTRYTTLLVVMTAVVVVGAMQILGVILVAAMLVVPAAAASQIGVSFRETVVLAIIFGQISAFIGLVFSVVASLPPGGSIVMIAIGIYVLAIVVSNRSVPTISMH
ncbi:metal ABC transporter permease [Halorubrum vacuolatum]|uniref:Zinc transport system permease protein n=1 Tax=Halorubrum vacuolatum TaxID=63740 RepID=A0A238Y1W0_HALVU|nr:metal ABC transporter permease [Halorubrum vacuolatum]SNR65097.1 zinc transport system permease protein [Halorubrum vacuolatum]